MLDDVAGAGAEAFPSDGEEFLWTEVLQSPAIRDVNSRAIRNRPNKPTTGTSCPCARSVSGKASGTSSAGVPAVSRVA